MKKGFTLAEALITLGIIGVVAAMTIPAVLVNVNNQEYKTGLRKAVSTLNDAIALNIALDGKKPKDVSANSYENAPRAYSEYFQKHMNVLKSTTKFPIGGNVGFYTNDGIKYEMVSGMSINPYGKEITAASYFNPTAGTGCNSQFPCALVVDVNGDKNPNQAGIDRFVILIIDTKVIPYNSVAQKLMYGEDK